MRSAVCRTALDQVQGVLRPALELLQDRLFAVARGVVGIEPTTKNTRVQLGFASSRHCPHTPLSVQRIAFSSAWGGAAAALM